jgi:hypothetical protein
MDLGVIVLFVQNLAVSFEIPRKIIGLARGRFRETSVLRMQNLALQPAAPPRPNRTR